MHIRTGFGIACLASAAASPSLGQVAVDTVDDALYTYNLSTAPSLAVSDDIVVVMGSHQLTMFDNAFPLGTPAEADYGPTLPDGTFPFKPVQSPSSGEHPSLIFPCADYDPYDGGRIWMMYSEFLPLSTSQEPEVFAWCYPYLHLAVQKDPGGSTPTGFSTGDWWYYTGSPSPMGAAGNAFNVGLDPLFGGPVAFDSSNPDDHLPVTDNPTLPRFAFDEEVIVIASTERGDCFEGIQEGGSFELGFGEQTLLIIPREHDSGTKSILDGDRPAESDIIIARLMGEPFIEDNSYHNCPVQEPHEQEDNAMLFISTTGARSSDDIMTSIRLKGLFKDSAGKWQLRQQLQGVPGSFSLKDMQIPSSSMYYKTSTPFSTVDTPTDFEPTVEGTFFTSAVLTKNADGNDRVFAVHAVPPDALAGTPWRVQWYVIDPKLADLRDTDVKNTDWQPRLVRWGQITDDGGENGGHCYHPVLGVTRQGDVYIEYTFSSETVEHRIIRAKLDATYTGVASSTVRKLGPSLEYPGDRWALYADMQHDPTRCLLWSTHTLVHDDTAPSGTIDERDVWLMTTGYNCFTTDMNADGLTDSYDMALYSDLYHMGHARADTNSDGFIEPQDLANYIAAYDAATSR